VEQERTEEPRKGRKALPDNLRRKHRLCMYLSDTELQALRMMMNYYDGGNCATKQDLQGSLREWLLRSAQSLKNTGHINTFTVV
jgi:hypothetical protein